MKIETLKDLTDLVKMCRKNGVRSITIDGIQMQIDEQIDKTADLKTEAAKDTPEYSPDDILFWSSSPTEGA